MTPSPSPEEVDAACAAARVPGAGISRMDMVAALEAAAEVREAQRQAAEKSGRKQAAGRIRVLRERLEAEQAADRVFAVRDRLQVQQNERERKAGR